MLSRPRRLAHRGGGGRGRTRWYVASSPIIPEAHDHTVNTGTAELLFLQRTSIPEDLELARHGLTTAVSDPAYLYLRPDGASIAYWCDARKTVDEIAHFSRRDALAFVKLAETPRWHADNGGSDHRGQPDAARYRGASPTSRGGPSAAAALSPPSIASLVTKSGEALIDQRFERPVVRSALCSLIGGVVPVTTRGSAVTAIFLAFLHSSGVQRPIGGMQAVPNALVDYLRDNWGQVLLGTPVKSVTVDRGRATGADVCGLRSSLTNRRQDMLDGAPSRRRGRERG